MPSHRANHYGTICEKKAVDRYGLELDRSSWHDARRSDGTPVEIKSTMRTHADGQPGNFKLYERYHRQLRKANGWYVFVVYRSRGQGITVLKMKMRHSSRLPLLTWHGGGGHRNTKQAKLDICKTFSSTG
ncbi:hypothetical protein [Halosimplex sp. J119]